MNKKFLRVLSIILSVVMLCSFTVVAGAKETKAISKVTVRVEGLDEYIDSDNLYIEGEKTLKTILETVEVDVVFAENSDDIISVEGQEEVEGSKWQVTVDSAIVTGDFSDYLIDSDANIVLYNAAENAVVPQIDDSELANAGILVINGIDKDGNVAPISGLKVVWDDAVSFTTNADGQVFISEKYLAAGEHAIALSKVNDKKISTIVRLAPSEVIEVSELEKEDKEELSTYEEVYKFFYDIFKGIVEVWMFFISAISGLFGGSSAQ